MSNPVRLKLVGERHPNADGSSRQDELSRCSEGDPVELRREPDNPYDPQAVAVWSERGVQLGYLGSDRAGWIGGKLAKGFEVSAAIDRIMGGGFDHPCLAAVLVVSLSPPRSGG